jgi:hypothetical protein
MKSGMLAVLAVGVLAVVVGIGFVTWQMNAKKGEIGLATRYEAQFNVVESTLFKMRASIKNIHACNDEWADKFIKVVEMQASGRGGNRVPLPEGSAGVAVAASSPTLQIGRESEALGIPQELYLKLSNAIEGQLADFTRQQDILTDVWREHTAYCKDPYHNWLGLAMASKVKPKPEMITSQDTKDAVATKKMDEKLF